MSEANIELVRAIFRGWNDEGVEGMLPLFHKDIEYTPMEERGTIHGHDGLRRYFQRWMESWDELVVEPREPQARGEQVLTVAEVTGRGRDSGADVKMSYWQVWTIRDGKAARWDEYLDRTEAFLAAGLRDEPAP